MQPADSYPARQTNNGLTVAVVPYSSSTDVKTVFGKTNLLDFGVLPVLVVMKNGSGKALKLDTMELHYVTPEQRKVEETPASEVKFIDSPDRPNFGGNPLPIPRRKPKSKLSGPEIEGFAFNAKMLPPNDSAHGFAYFQIGHRPGSRLYIRGIVEAPTGKELMYFDIPFDAK